MYAPLQPTFLDFLGYFSHLRCPSNSFIPYSVQLGESTHPSQHPHFLHIQLLLVRFLHCPCFERCASLLVLVDSYYSRDAQSSEKSVFYAFLSFFYRLFESTDKQMIYGRIYGFFLTRGILRKKRFLDESTHFYLFVLSSPTPPTRLGVIQACRVNFLRCAK